MDKLSLIWLQEIANCSKEFGYNTYEKIKAYFEDENKMFFLNYMSEDLINKIKPFWKDYALLMDKGIKIKARGIYESLKLNYFDVISYEYFKDKYIDKSTMPFCVFVDKRSKMNFRKVLKTNSMYIHYDKYFSEYGRRIINYFISNIERENKGISIFSPIVSNMEVEKVIDSKILDVTYVSDMNELVLKSNIYLEYLNCIILPNEKYYLDFYTSITDFCIIIEARYEQNIVEKVNMFLEKSKEIYVVPADIYKKNSYFSNYLIKQGAQIVLNRWDIIEIIKNISC